MSIWGKGVRKDAFFFALKKEKEKAKGNSAKRRLCVRCKFYAMSQNL